MAKAVTKLVRDKIRETLKWVPERGLFVRQDLNDLEESLPDVSLQGLGRTALSLEMLAMFHGRDGISRVLANDRYGWPEIQRSMTYYLWVAKIRAQMFFRTTFLQPILGAFDLTNEMNLATCLLCHFIATDQGPQQEVLAEIMLGAVQTTGAVSDWYWRGRHFDPFVLRLYQMKSGIALPRTVMERDLGPYEAVLDHWNNTDTLGDALLAICDYHCGNMEDQGKWKPEFGIPPFDLLPSEILAIASMRKKLGLQMPVIQHSLLGTGLESMPFGEIEVVEDAILDRVEVAYISVFGQ